VLLGGASHPGLTERLARALPLELRGLGGGCGAAVTSGLGVGRGVGVGRLDLGARLRADARGLEDLVETIWIHS
jgi:hypothetical protein